MPTSAEAKTTPKANRVPRIRVTIPTPDAQRGRAMVTSKLRPRTQTQTPTPALAQSPGATSPPPPPISNPHGPYDPVSLEPTYVFGVNEAPFVGSLPYQAHKAHDAERQRRHAARAAGRLSQPRPLNLHRDLRFAYEGLDNTRSVVYSTGTLSSSGQSATGVQLAGTFLNVLELETAFRVCDLTPKEAEAYRLSVFTGLEREEVAETLDVSLRQAGNLIGRASRKLVNYVYDHPLRDLLA